MQRVNENRSHPLLNFFYHLLLVVLFFTILASYVTSEIRGDYYISLSRYFWLFMSVGIYVIYIILYRERHLFCFETIFLFLFIFTTFFNEIVIENLRDITSVSPFYFRTSFGADVEHKSLYVQMLGYYSFLLGSSLKRRSQSERSSWDSLKILGQNFDYNFPIKFLTFIIVVYFAYLLYNGTISSWFHYSSYVPDYSNSEIIYLTVLLLVDTLLVFVYLSSKGCTNFKECIIQIDKLYFSIFTIVSLLLIISGNRNEALLVLMPFAVMFSLCIKHISNKHFLVGVGVGVVLMIFIGLIRQNYSDSISPSEVSLYDATRDYVAVEKSTTYLIQYTDNNGAIHFKNTAIALCSSVPFLGGIVSSAFNIQPDIRSVDITTEGMQVRSNMDSGLGTSLVGDVYYTAKGFFVCMFFVLFGLLMSSLYERFEIRKDFNVWMLIIYIYLISNSVYIIRAEWNMPFRYIGFSFVILLFLSIFSLRKNSFF